MTVIVDGVNGSAVEPGYYLKRFSDQSGLSIAQASVINFTTATPPNVPALGDAYVVATGGTGAWAGKDGQIAVWQVDVVGVSSWAFYAPQQGWSAYDKSTSTAKVYNGSAWIAGSIQSADLASTASGKGSSLVGLLGGSTVEAAVNPRQFVVRGAQVGVDAYPLIAAQVAACKAAGGGTVLLPDIGGYTISQTVVVDFDDCTILLDDDVTLTKTNASALVGPDAAYQTGVNGIGICAFAFCGQLLGPIGGRRYINRPALIGLRPVIINGNGANAAAAGFTYVVGSAGAHASVVFQGTINARCENIRPQNGLVGCILANYSPQIIIDKCLASTTQHDNGITVAFNREHLVAFSDTDPTTWCHATIRDCLATSCRNHGIGSYGAVGVNIINPVVFNCGNNASGGQTPSGPAGGVNIEFDGTNYTRDYRVTIINPRVYNSWGFGLRTNCKGTRVIGGGIFGTKNPTGYTDSTPKVWGSNVFLQGAATLELIGTDVENGEQFGVRGASAGGYYPSLYIRGGRYSGNGSNPAANGAGNPSGQGTCIYLTDFNEVTISAETLFVNNGNTSDTTAGNQYTIYLSNAGYNVDAGLAVIGGRFESNKGGIVIASRVGTLDITRGISGIANGAAWASGYFMVYVLDKVTNLHLSNINLSQNGNSKTARLGYITTVVNLYANWNSIVGDQNSLVLPKVQIGAVTAATYSPPPIGTVFAAYTASYTPNSGGISTIIFGSPFLTGNMVIQADSPSVPAVDDQTLTFVLIQDATGGRTVSWNSAWKGATLTGSGTANQRAVVTFRRSSGAWYQVSSTGWLS